MLLCITELSGPAPNPYKFIKQQSPGLHYEGGLEVNCIRHKNYTVQVLYVLILSYSLMRYCQNEVHVISKHTRTVKLTTLKQLRVWYVLIHPVFDSIA